MSVLVVQERAYLSQKGHAQLNSVMADQRELYNSALKHRRYAYEGPRVRLDLKAQSRELTDVRAHDPRYEDVDRRVQAATLMRLNKAYNSAFSRLNRGEKPGFPHETRHVRTLEVYSGSSRYLRRGDNGRVWIQIKGLPKMRIKRTERIPEESQPLNMTITRKPNGVYIGMSFRFEDALMRETRPEVPVGINRGVVRRATMTTGNALPSRDRTENLKAQRRLLRKMQRQRDAALSEERAVMEHAGFNRKTGKRRYKLKWILWSHSYGKTREQYVRLRHRENVRNMGDIHQFTASVVASHDGIFIEDFDTLDMMKSARGNEENPGSDVERKTRLNRRIAEQNWGAMAEQLAYKAKAAGYLFARVSPEHISQTCPVCGTVGEFTLVGREFTCLSCEFRGDVDLIAAYHVLIRGLIDSGFEPDETNYFRGGSDVRALLTDPPVRPGIDMFR